MKINKSILSLRTLFLLTVGILFAPVYGIGIFIFIYAILDKFNDYIIIEKDRIIYRKGILNKKQVILPTGRSDINWRIDQSFYQTIMGLCDFVVSNKNELIVIYANDYPKKRIKEAVEMVINR